MLRSLSYFFVILFVFFTWTGSAQSLADTMQRNKVKLTVEPNGHLFTKNSINTPAYEVPADSGNHLIYRASAWFMGKNENHQIKASISQNKYIPNTAHYKGPYSSKDAYLSVDYLTKHKNNQWHCTKEEVIYHIDNHAHPNYILPESIATWPGNGDTTLGVAFQLAPFVDLNDNGIYEPELGEYPCFKGDEAIYTILNDHARVHGLTGERGMGLELHCMVYQINNGDYLDSTTFVDITVYNRGIENYPEFRSAFFVDADVGFAFDDYLGTHPATNTLYFYNSTNHDAQYGENPPAVGITALNHSVSSINMTVNSGFFNPQTVTSFWRWLNGKHQDGTSIFIGGNGYYLSTYATTTETNFLYHGEPWSGIGWSEVNIDGNGKRNPNDEDKRGHMAMSPIALNSGEQITYSYAIVTSRKGNYLENTKGVVELAEKVKIFYDESDIGSCVRVGTGVQDNIVIALDEIDPFLQFEITLLDGTGNMLQDLELTEETVDQILKDGFTATPTYERTKAPIIVEIADTANHATGHFLLWFKDFSTGQENIDWVIYQHEYKGGAIIDSVHSTETILVDGVHYIEKWEFFVQVNNYLPACSDFDINCPTRERIQTMKTAEMVFKEDIPWLTGVQNLRGWMPQYWINDNQEPHLQEFNNFVGNTWNNPGCYNFKSPVNNDYRYSNLIGGIIAPASSVRTNHCGFMPIQIPTQIGISPAIYQGIRLSQQAPYFHPSIDIVLTSDQSKWTRCPVIELNNDPALSLHDPDFGDTPLPGLLRQSKSTDKAGRQLGDAGYNAQEANPNGDQPVGMGWFPGYAIDVESGRRLNMAFGENSLLLNQNGGDMQWNPTSNSYNAIGAPLFGGQHAIYVFGGEFDGMPNYDQGHFLHEKLSNKTADDFRAAYRNLSWVMQPLLAENQELLATDVKIRVRWGKTFRNRSLTHWNHGMPLFEWSAVPYSSLFPKPDNNFLLAYPNPTAGTIYLKWEDPEIKEIILFDAKGAQVKKVPIENDQFNVQLSLDGLRSGMYFLRANQITKKIVLTN